MSGAFTFQLDSSTFEGGMRDLARMTGKDFKEVVHNEGHAILKKSIKNTKAASAANIRAHYTYKGVGATPSSVIGHVTLNGKKRRVRSIKYFGKWVEDKKGRRWDKFKVNPEFKELTKVLKARLKWAKDRRGQSKATWVYIGKRAKLKPLTAPGYVMKALELMPQSLKRQLRGKDVGMSSSVYYLLIGNAGRTAMAPKSKKGPGGYLAFKDAYNGRIAYFKMNMEKGAFETIEKTLKKYPGLSVS
tara:strand:- start:296 stop:1030 length:735 start_codon:yes stop_codon:yes gene_type:complete